jgi:hypothetical protein
MEIPKNALGRIENVLDNFRSYSTQFTLFVCRTTEKARLFAALEGPEFLSAVNDVKKLGDPVKFGASTDDVYLAIDTRRFSQFSVESLRYDVYLNGLQKGASTSNLAADLQMVVLDAVGISFAEFLQFIMDKKLESSYDGMIFMLRTMFVGHNADGTTETVHTETIPMHLNRIEINLDFAKGAYTMEFMPNMNFDVKKYHRFLSIGNETGAVPRANDQLGGIISGLEERLNTASKKHYDFVQKTLKDIGRTKAGDKPKGRLVKYQITLPDKWANFKSAGKNVTAANEPKNRPADPKAPIDITTAGGETNLNLKPGMSITAAIDEIFKTVPEIAELGNFKQTDPSKDGSVTFYKQIVGLTSNDEEVCVHVDVIDYTIPNAFRRKRSQKDIDAGSISQKTHHTIKDDNGNEFTLPNDYAEYDYIFTGRNKDILSLELKVQEFQMLLASNLKIGPADLLSATSDGVPPDPEVARQIEEILNARPNDPIFLPLLSKEQEKGFTDLTRLGAEKQDEAKRKRQNYTRNLSMFYSGSPVVTTMSIRGNPAIMHKFNISQIATHTSTPANSGKRRVELENEILSKNSNTGRDASNRLTITGFSNDTYAKSPVFVKVNIYGPPNNEEWSNKKSVLSDVYYVVFKLSNVFQNGAFTQELELYSHNVFGPAELGKATK